jgi:hypothetical protein
MDSSTTTVHDDLDDNKSEKVNDYIPNNASNTLLHRLAGPSTGKAGLAVDQTEITRVIAEASEGSKFYQVRFENAWHDLWLNVKLLEEREAQG